MRITFVLPYAGLAGGIRVVAIYADRLQKRRHRVVVVSTPWRPPSLQAKVRSLIRGKGWPAAPKNKLSYFDGVDVPHRVIDSSRAVMDADVPDADVVVATWWRTAQSVAALSPNKGAKAYFVQDYGASGQPLEEVVPTWSLPMHKITISKWLLDLVQAHCGNCSVSLVPNGVDLDQFNAPSRGKQQRPTVGLLYTTTPAKRCVMILDAVARAKKHLPDLHVVAFGVGELSKEMPLPPGSEYTRQAPDDMLKVIYRRCDAWLFGTRREGFGLPILEAMACRTPVIATPAGAAPELLDGGGGILVKPEDPAEMARAIVQVCSLGTDDWKVMSDAAYATAAKHRWDPATDLFEQALQKAIERAKSGEIAGGPSSLQVVSA